MRRRTVLAAALASLLAGCSGGPAPNAPSTGGAPPAPASVPSSATPGATVSASGPATPAPPTPTECAARIVDAMGTAERAGQVVMVGVTGASGPMMWAPSSAPVAGSAITFAKWSVSSIAQP